MLALATGLRGADLAGAAFFATAFLTGRAGLGLDAAIGAGGYLGTGLSWIPLGRCGTFGTSGLAAATTFFGAGGTGFAGRFETTSRSSSRTFSTSSGVSRLRRTPNRRSSSAWPKWNSSNPAADRDRATIALATGLRNTAAMPGRASIRDEIWGAANSVT